MVLDVPQHIAHVGALGTPARAGLVRGLGCLFLAERHKLPTLVACSYELLARRLLCKLVLGCLEFENVPSRNR
jgi:hypothetical protein